MSAIDPIQNAETREGPTVADIAEVYGVVTLSMGEYRRLLGQIKVAVDILRRMGHPGAYNDAQAFLAQYDGEVAP